MISAGVPVVPLDNTLSLVENHRTRVACGWLRSSARRRPTGHLPRPVGFSLRMSTPVVLPSRSVLLRASPKGSSYLTGCPDSRGGQHRRFSRTSLRKGAFADRYSGTVVKPIGLAPGISSIAQIGRFQAIISTFGPWTWLAAATPIRSASVVHSAPEVALGGITMRSVRKTDTRDGNFLNSLAAWTLRTIQTTMIDSMSERELG
jgi:hypothetical protein